MGKSQCYFCEFCYFLRRVHTTFLRGQKCLFYGNSFSQGSSADTSIVKKFWGKSVAIFNTFRTLKSRKLTRTFPLKKIPHNRSTIVSLGSVSPHIPTQIKPITGNIPPKL